MIVCEEQEDKVTLRLSGDMTVQTMPELHEKMIEILEMKKNVEVVFAGIEDADISFLQMMCAAHRSFYEIDRLLTVSGDKNGLLEMKKASGFIRHQGCSRDKCKNCVLVKE